MSDPIVNLDGMLTVTDVQRLVDALTDVKDAWGPTWTPEDEQLRQLLRMAALLASHHQSRRESKAGRPCPDSAVALTGCDLPPGALRDERAAAGLPR